MNSYKLQHLIQLSSLLFLVQTAWAEDQTEVLSEVEVSSTPLSTSAFESAQPVSTISQEQLQKQGALTLGDALSNQLGISSTGYAPGASRPVIRGLDGDRVRVLQDGVGTLDASTTSPDHAVGIEPINIERVEVIRGPAALKYGTTAIGGAVNIIDNRIPQKLAEDTVDTRAEINGNTNNNARSAAASVDANLGELPVVLHVDGFSRTSDDIRIPGFARTPALRAATENEAHDDDHDDDHNEAEDHDEDHDKVVDSRGRLRNSASEADSFTIGTSVVDGEDFIGVSVNSFNTNYDVPGEHAITIDLEQQRLDLKGKTVKPMDGVEAMEFRAGVSNYKHQELEGAEIGTVFKNDGFEGRYELTHSPIGMFKGIVGLQAQRSELSATGEEAFLPKTETKIGSLFFFEEAEIEEDLKFNFGGRLDDQSTSTDAYRAFGAGEQQLVANSQGFTTFSASAGTIWNPYKDYAVALSIAHTERAPTGTELFANGPHFATSTFEVGDPTLDTEKSWGFDLSLRKRNGPITGSIGLFYNRFSNYIGLLPTGQISGKDGEAEDHDEEHEDDHDDDHDHHAALPIYRFESINADIYGVESELVYHLFDGTAEEERRNKFNLFFRPDFTIAMNRDSNDPLPRIPPVRLRIGTEYQCEDFGADLEIQQVFRQSRTAEFETGTASYTFLNVGIHQDFELSKLPLQFYLRGLNLLNEKARNHISFLKDVAPLPGMGVLGGVRVNF
jgi:iron complex outermembrane receptor protein